MPSCRWETISVIIASGLFRLKPASRLLSYGLIQRRGGQFRAFRQGAEFRPGDLRMGATAEAAIGTGDHILLAEQRCESLNPLSHEFRMFHNVRRMRDHSGN